MGIEIITAGINDLEILSKLFDDYRRWYHQESDIGKAKAFLQERMEKSESVIFLAISNGKAVGFTQLYPIFSSVQMERAWLLNDLFVAADARKLGVASALLNHAKDYGSSTGAKFLMLQTGIDNLDAQRLYLRRGWDYLQDYIYQLNLG